MTLLPKYRNLLSEIDSAIDDIDFDNSERNIVSAALLDVAHDYAKGISVLFEDNLDASGFALTRSLFETFIRAVWLRRCATDKELGIFIRKDKIELEGNKQLHFADMVKAVEQSSSWPPTLSNIQSRGWKALNSYTHGGMQHVTRRFNGATIEPHHDPDQVNEVIQFACLISIQALAEIADMSGSSTLIAKTKIMTTETIKWCFNNSSQQDASTAGASA